MISLTGQIEEIERELELRRRVYPRRVAAGKMRQSIADYHLQRMQAVLTTLQQLQVQDAKESQKTFQP